MRLQKKRILHIALVILALMTALPVYGMAQDVEGPPTVNTACLVSFFGHSAFICRDDTLPWTTAGIILMGGVVAVAGIQMGWALRQQRFYPAWRMSLHLVGWIPAAVTGGVLALFILVDQMSDGVPGLEMLAVPQVLGAVLPLAVGVLSAFVFSPADEASLELMLAAPRRIAWALLERWAAVLITQGAIGLVATLVVMGLTGERDFVMVVAGWLTPVVLFGGIGMVITLITRQAILGVALTILVWFGMAFIGAGVVIMWPFTWPLYPFLHPALYGPDLFWLNRLFLTLAGLSLIVLAVRQVRDDERVLGINKQSS